ncbi:MAG: D-alanyl-D-alanine endopeptidase [Formivibrio sp.]|nr:D-alanyl-D-alanine endopeptidase [Formivibrio sp.]
MRKPLIFFCSALATLSLIAAPFSLASTTKHHKASAKQHSAAPADHIVVHSKTSKHTVATHKSKNVSSRAIANARRGVSVARTSARPSTLERPGVQSAGVLVINQLTGDVIFEKNADVVTPIASITKLMTAMVVLDAKLPLNELITISEDDLDKLKGTSSRLKPGLTLTRGEMMLLALMSSENRAASALSRNYPGGREAFIKAMNAKAASLGMTHSHFFDPTGLNPNNVSTPRELALMVKAAREYPEIHQFTTSSEYSLTSNRNGRSLEFHNTNPLVKDENWEIGLSKTGYINEAGHCIVMQARINDTPVVMILMDSTGKYTRIGDAQRMRRWLETSPTAKLHMG